MRVFFTFALILLVRSAASGQDWNADRLTPFEKHNFQDTYDQNDRFNLEDIRPGSDSVQAKLENRSSIRIFTVPEKEMAKMPTMKIDEDTHYTIQIKRYNRCYPYINESKPLERNPSDGLKLYQPLNKKLEKE